MNQIVIIGGGAAGMMAAYAAAVHGTKVHLIEKNEKLGKKLFITGKGRCNLTNACDPEDFFTQVTSNYKFLYSSFYTFSNSDVIDLFENSGCRLKVERGNRVFPQSDHSSDVIRALEQLLKANHVQVHLRTSVTEILVENNQVKGVRTSKGEVIATSKVLIATGGLSYPTTGSTGDGYQFAKKCNHTVTPLTPSLVPFNVADDYVKQWQ